MDVPLDDLPVEARRALPFDHPSLDAHAAKVEAEHGLPVGMLRALKNAGERSQSGAVSPKGALGVMQFIPDTAARYGLKDPTDPLEAINAAGRYVKDISAKIGSSDPALIAAGYNAGENRDSLRQGRIPNIPETQAYAARIKAAMPGFTAPGTDVPESDLPQDLRPAPAAKPKSDGVVRDANGVPVTLDPTKSRGALDPTRGQSFTENALAGVGKAMHDIPMGALQAAGDFAMNTTGAKFVPALKRRFDTFFAPAQAKIDESARLDKPLMGTGGGITGNVGGQIAGSLVLPMSNAYKGMAAVGAAGGALQPVSTEEGPMGRAKNMATGAGGAVVGKAVADGIGAAVRGAKAAVEPFYEKGKDAITGRLLNKVAGPEAPNIAQRLSEAAKPFVGPSLPGMERATMGEIVPGSVPTVGQAAGDAGIAALERTATAIDPVVGRAHAERLANQNAARAGQLETMAGTDGARAFHEAAREATADQLYGKAFRAGITPARAAKFQPEIADLMQNPAIQDALPVARRLAKYDGIDLADPAGSLQGLHYVKKAIDDMLAKGKQTGIGNIEAAKMAQTQERLLGLMDNLSPAYGAARAEYQAASRPLNQMDIAGELKKKATNNLTENLKPQAFADNLNDATAARATGFKGSTLENTLEPGQLNTLQRILEDLRRARAAETSGRGVGSDTVQKLAYSNMVDQAGVPTFIRNLSPAQAGGNLVGRLLDSAYGRANRELSGRVAETMMDPSLAARLMQAAAQQAQPGVASRIGQVTFPRIGMVSAPYAAQQ